MNGFQYKLLSGAIAVMLLASILYVGKEAAVYVTGRSVDAEREKVCVVIDAGHGGDDPGKVGINGVNEKRRIEAIEDVSPALTVSIHQNSYPEEYVHGAQVFYYTGSTQGQLLAEAVQGQLIKRVDPENRRRVKANDSYYLLKKTGVPIVIVECGFLSNGGEAEKLCSPDYQQRVAWAIHMGILQYLNKNEK